MTAQQKDGSSGLPVRPRFRREMIGGVVAGLVLLAGTLSVGQLSGAEAKHLLESMLPTARFLYSGIITASATILALMLTLLSVSFDTSSRLDPAHYARIRRIAFIDTIAFVLALSFLVFLVVPFDEPKNLVPKWYQVFYYVTIGGSAVLGGLLVTVVLMLYATVRDMIAIFGFREEDHPLVSEEDT